MLILVMEFRHLTASSQQKRSHTGNWPSSISKIMSQKYEALQDFRENKSCHSDALPSEMVDIIQKQKRRLESHGRVST